eukprot:1069782-Amorphochlora_amoeboformis.AAC.1
MDGWTSVVMRTPAERSSVEVLLWYSLSSTQPRDRDRYKETFRIADAIAAGARAFLYREYVW